MQNKAATFEEDVQKKRKFYEDEKDQIAGMVENVFKEIKLEEDPSLEDKNAWKEETLNFDQAWDCTNRLARETGMVTKTEKQMRDAFAKLDYDGDEIITLAEMIEFERDRQNEENVLLIGIYWIGHNLQEDYDEDVMEELDLLKEEKREDGSKLKLQYEVTCIGQPICINEYATQIAGGDHTYVVHIDDFNPIGMRLESKHLDIKTESEVEQLILDSRTWARSRNTFLPQCETNKFCTLLKTRREQNQIFQIPFHL